jgi:ankyrin repeat protein
MIACNRYFESILHTACRRADASVVDYLLQHSPLATHTNNVLVKNDDESADTYASEQETISSLEAQWRLLVDDYGRTPLHDACWRVDTSFVIVSLLLDMNIDLLKYQDCRGSIPLHYVQKDQWVEWCAFFELRKNHYWPVRNL